MRGFVVIACLLMMCCATPKPRENFEQLFDERAHNASQYQPYRPIDYELVPAVPYQPQPEVIEVMRYVVAHEVSGVTVTTPTPAPVPDPPAEPEPEPTYDEGPWRPYGY